MIRFMYNADSSLTHQHEDVDVRKIEVDILFLVNFSVQIHRIDWKHNSRSCLSVYVVIDPVIWITVWRKSIDTCAWVSISLALRLN